MGFEENIWKSLKYKAGKATDIALSSLAYRYVEKEKGVLQYKSKSAYRNVFVHLAKQIAMQAVESEINSLYPRYRRYLADKQRQKVLAQQDANHVQLIKEGVASTIKYGYVPLPESSQGGIYAMNKYGEHVPEALMLHYEGDEFIEITSNYTGEDDKLPYKETFRTKTVLFTDLAPSVSIQSGKNLIKTKVQGRDYSRKELVSGDDVVFSVSGHISVDKPDVYPTNEVQKFIQIMRYGGIVNVSHFQFGAHNINKVIIQDYSLGVPTYKNMQPYSFTCVAIEPDEDVIIKQDTIGALNNEIKLSPMSSWYKLILDSKMSEVVAGAGTSLASSIATAGFDKLINKI